jgi:methylene-tetrahydromethanopterin dehydrogenase
MGKKRLLYLVSTDPHVSPFDVNMAYDAGFDAVIPYGRITAADVGGLTQDIMFSRGPKGVRATSIFFSGSDLKETEELLSTARAVLFDPFRVGLMIDPRGGYTTAGALLAKASALARGHGLSGAGGGRVLVMAGTGVVGSTAAAMAARAGAKVVLTSRKAEKALAATRELASLFEVEVTPRPAASEAEMAPLAHEADIILATGSAGVQLLSDQAIGSLRGPKIVADVNAVPPAGIAGVKAQDDGREVAPGIFALGALAIGDLKFKVEASLLKDLLTSGEPPLIDNTSASRRAEEILTGS